MPNELKDAADEHASFASTLITSRQSILPRRLVAPGPSPGQVRAMFTAAAAAPDHGMLVPWRFVLVPQSRRTALADVFVQALLERDAAATPEQAARAREKAFRSPFLALAIARLGPADPAIDPLERMVSLGAALQNFLLSAHSMGYGAGLTSGQAMHSAPLRGLFDLVDGEHAICFINVGTASLRKPSRVRPEMASFVSSL